MKGALLFAQSGGPTAVINSSACGVFQEAKKHPEITNIYAGLYGIDGVLSGNIIDINKEDDEQIELLKQTPSSALGSCRKKMPDYKKDEAPYKALIEVFKKYGVRYFIYNGGNDSMDTCNKVAKYCKLVGYECAVVGVPKTVDNDLASTDHCPGFGSVAKYIATTIHEIALDAHVFKNGRAVIVEIMGRDAGWITASAAVPELLNGLGADLVYVPEKPFDLDKFTQQVKEVLDKNYTCVVAVSEGIRLADGSYVGASTAPGALDAFGHAKLSGAGKALEYIVKDRIGCKVRSIELNLPQRCAAHLLSLTDISESVTVGMTAVSVALEGRTGVMMTINRNEGAEYSSFVDCAEISSIANAVRGVPDEYINETCDGITDAGLRYLAPLIVGEVDIVYEAGLPKHFVIE